MQDSSVFKILPLLVPYLFSEANSDSVRPCPVILLQWLPATSDSAEIGDYAKASGSTAYESEPTTITLAGSANYDTIKIQYGPRPSQV